MEPTPEVSERVLAARSLMEKIKTNAAPAETTTPVAASAEDARPDFVDPRLLGHKDQIIASILKLQQGGLCPPSGKLTQKKLREMKRADLEKLLSSLYAAGVTPSASKGQKVPAPVVLKETKDPATGKVVAITQAMTLSNETAVNQLMIFNRLVVKCVELASVTARDKLELSTDLEGLTDDFARQEAELKPILAEVWKKHGPSMTPYLEPAQMYAGFMLGLTVNRGFANLKKDSSSPDGLPEPSLRK